MFRSSVFIFIISVAVLPIFSQQLKNWNKDYKRKLRSIAEKFVLMVLVTDFSNLSKVKEILKTEKGRNYVTVWLKEIDSIIISLNTIIFVPNVKIWSDQAMYLEKQKQEYLNRIAEKCYDSNAASPWPIITFDPVTRNVSFDCQNHNKSTDRNVTDPYVTNSQINEYFNDYLDEIKESSEKLKLQKLIEGKRCSELDYKKATDRFFYVKNYLKQVEKNFTI